MYDICIIGGGASGMAAAISAAIEVPDLRICILEKREKPGKKLAATGNGRCNITNLACPKVGETIDFFKKIGVAVEEEKDGWMYPISRQGEDVAVALRSALDIYNINVIVNTSAERIEKKSRAFVVNGNFHARHLLIAAGGKAGPQFGTTGDGYGLAKSLGHKVTKLVPVLTALETETEQGSDLRGVRARACVSLLCKGENIGEEIGEVQFTADGLSGICIFNLSRFVDLNQDTSFGDYRLHLDFLPHKDREDVRKIMEERERNGVDLLRSLVPAKLCKSIYRRGRSPEELAAVLKDYSVKVTGVKGWKQAQCTAGGIEWSQVDRETMESKLTENLFFSGEILDYDGPCGGFNLQNAWETGIMAGKEMARRAGGEREGARGSEK